MVVGINSYGKFLSGSFSLIKPMGAELFGFFSLTPYKLVKLAMSKIYDQFSSYNIKKT